MPLLLSPDAVEAVAGQHPAGIDERAGVGRRFQQRPYRRGHGGGVVAVGALVFFLEGGRAGR
jgi:hypothetical protein